MTRSATTSAVARESRSMSPTGDVLDPPPEITDYLDHLAKERDVSPNTVRAYDRDLQDFVGVSGAVL